MWNIVAAILIATACLKAQKYSDLLLPKPLHIVGLVVDQEGKPIAEASIDHSGDHRRAYLTDTGGRFELDTRVPIVVIRKAGYRVSCFGRTMPIKCELFFRGPRNARF